MLPLTSRRKKKASRESTQELCAQSTPWHVNNTDKVHNNTKIKIKRMYTTFDEIMWKKNGD